MFCVFLIAEYIMAAENVPTENVPALAPPITAFTTTATNPTIYIQQFWNTIKNDAKNGIFSCQLDEQWFNLNEEVFRDALGITPYDPAHPFKAPITSNALIDFIMELWYPRELSGVSFMSKHNFHPRTESLLHIPNEDSVLGNLKFVAKGVKYKVFRMPILDALITNNIKNAPYYFEYLEMVAKHERRVTVKKSGQGEPAVPEPSAMKAAKVTKPKAAKQSGQTVSKATKPTIHKATTPSKPTSSRPPKPKPAPTKPSKAVPEKKPKLVKETPDEPSPAKRSKGGLVGRRCKPKSPLKLVDEFADEGVPISEPRVDDEEADYQRGVELSLKDLEARNQGLARTIVIQEPDSRRIQSLLENKSATDQYILQRRTPKTAEPTGTSSQPKDKGITMTNSEMKSDEVVTLVNKDKDASYMELTEINTRVHNEGQAGSNPEVSNAYTQQNPEQMYEEFTTNAYLNVQENLKLLTKDQEEEPEKIDADLEVQSMVMVPIQQDTSLVPPMTTPFIDLTIPQPDSPTIHTPLPTSSTTTTAITTTTTLPPPSPPPQP
uniref:Histone deacetylase 14 n=1 Tax=Tanacetum cinerariifolium TaxID=118510 RepID=A0A6L2JD53_TANCI|nr:histone deacetylase 14 [Tanacetum cinerariifolium]